MIAAYGPFWRPVLDLPEQVKTARLKTAPASTVRTIAHKYLTEFDSVPPGIAPLFLGPASTWKTYCAAAVARYLHEARHIAVDFVEVPLLRYQLESERYNPATKDRVARLLSVPFLVMDDFAVIRPGTYATEVLETVIHSRFSQRRPTLWTGNLDLPIGQEWITLADMYGPMVARRLEQAAKGYTVMVKTRA